MCSSDLLEVLLKILYACKVVIKIEQRILKIRQNILKKMSMYKKLRCTRGSVRIRLEPSLDG